MMRASTMLGTSALTMRSLGAYDCLIPNGAYTQAVRWKRKPIWLPTAKSKVFRIPKKPCIPREETVEIQRLYNIYRTRMKALRNYFCTEEEKRQIKYNEEAVKQEEEDDFLKCTAINDKWNAQVAADREVRLANEWEERKQIIMKALEKKRTKDMMLIESIEEKVREVKEAAPTFITAENIDAAIDEVLVTIVDHNRAIDINGNFYTGSSPEIVLSKNNPESVEAMQ